MVVVLLVTHRILYCKLPIILLLTLCLCAHLLVMVLPGSREWFSIASVFLVLGRTVLECPQSTFILYVSYVGVGPVLSTTPVLNAFVGGSLCLVGWGLAGF